MKIFVSFVCNYKKSSAPIFGNIFIDIEKPIKTREDIDEIEFFIKEGTTKDIDNIIVLNWKEVDN